MEVDRPASQPKSEDEEPAMDIGVDPEEQEANKGDNLMSKRSPSPPQEGEEDVTEGELSSSSRPPMEGVPAALLEEAEQLVREWRAKKINPIALLVAFQKAFGSEFATLLPSKEKGHYVLSARLRDLLPSQFSDLDGDEKQERGATSDVEEGPEGDEIIPNSTTAKSMPVPQTPSVSEAPKRRRNSSHTDTLETGDFPGEEQLGASPGNSDGGSGGANRDGAQSQKPPSRQSKRRRGADSKPSNPSAKLDGSTSSSSSQDASDNRSSTTQKKSKAQVSAEDILVKAISDVEQILTEHYRPGSSIVGIPETKNHDNLESILIAEREREHRFKKAKVPAVLKDRVFRLEEIRRKKGDAEIDFCLEMKQIHDCWKTQLEHTGVRWSFVKDSLIEFLGGSTTLDDRRRFGELLSKYPGLRHPSKMPNKRARNKLCSAWRCIERREKERDELFQRDDKARTLYVWISNRMEELKNSPRACEKGEEPNSSSSSSGSRERAQQKKTEDEIVISDDEENGISASTSDSSGNQRASK